MSLFSRLRREADLWLNNGANLITLSRLPMLFCVQWALLGVATNLLPETLPAWLFCSGVISTWLMLVVWDSVRPPLVVVWTLLCALSIWWVSTWLGSLDADALFIFLMVMQTIGMITDGLDGRFARKRSLYRRGTPEGQFLDQFVDKIFVWTTWLVLTVIFWTMIRQWYEVAVLLLLSLASCYLFWLDIRSCYKHFGNYLQDRGKEYNKNSGAKPQGKIKFVLENVSICTGVLLLIFVTDRFGLRSHYPTLSLIISIILVVLGVAGLVFAIRLARASLRVRGVLKTRKERADEKLEELHRPPLPAEAVVDPDS